MTKVNATCFAATAVALACASTGSAQQADTTALDKTTLDKTASQRAEPRGAFLAEGDRRTLSKYPRSAQ